MKIYWDSAESHVLCNPRLSATEQAFAQQLIAHFPAYTGHFWLATSGSTGIAKWTVLSKRAVLASATAVNAHLDSNAQDCWINPLPMFHVGGLGILARAHLSRARVVAFDEKWNPDHFCEAIRNARATLSALVPTQLYDLVQAGHQSPATLRAVIIGGGALTPALATQAVARGWPILPSYGMTECASQIATAKTVNGPLHLLPHLEVKIENERICVRGASLLTGYAFPDANGFTFKDPKQQGWLHTEDLGTLTQGILHVHGRLEHFVKIGGESVDLLRLESLLDTICLELSLKADIALVAMPDSRLGHVIHLATTTPIEVVQPLVEHFAIRVLPFERIRHIHFLSEIPRSPLGKVRTAELKKQLTNLV